MLKPSIKRALPAHLLFLTAEQMVQRGWKLRQDVFMHLNRAAAAALAGLDALSVSLAAKEVDELARALLRDLSLDDPRDELLACAYFTLQLVSEKLFDDADNQAVLVSLMLM